MKLKNIIYIFSVFVSFVLVSCSEDIAPETGNKVKVEFNAGIMTRVADDQWDIGDAIGITMLGRTNNTIVENIYNYRYYTTSTTGDFLPGSERDIMYFPQNGEEVTFKSYYPYSASVQQNLVVPVSVASQDNLPAIDFMSADHITGFSKSDPNVTLDFNHRLSKAIFNLNVAPEVQNITLRDVVLTIKGMKTTGSYDLMNETLTVDDSSTNDIVIPVRGRDNERTGIVLPRAAGEGVGFELTTPNGDSFAGVMENDLALEAGYKYIFNITLHSNKVEISVTIRNWIEGPTSSYDMLGITTPAGDSYGVTAGDEMDVYIKNSSNEFQFLRRFTYGTDGKWTTPTPVYWDSILTDPVDLRAMLLTSGPANDTQLADIILSDELSVSRNTGADFELKHVGSRVTVQLQSNVFTADELNSATITLPGYLTGGRVENSIFIPGTSRGNVLIDRTDGEDQFAIIQPQPISPEAAIVRVNINERDYTANTTTDGFIFEAGTAYQLIVTVNESDVAVSARVIDWVSSGPHEFNILEVTPTLENTEGVEVGARMNVYLKDDTDNYNLWANFTYTGSNRWTPDTEVYWESITGNSADLRASIIAQPRLNATQMDDLLIADDLTVPFASGVDFVFRHVSSRLLVRLISDTFSQADLDNATITLPNYIGGGTESNGQFIAGTTMQNILLVETEPSGRAVTSVNPQLAFIQPQTIAADNNMFKVTIGTRDYWAVAPQGGFAYAAGTSYGITIHVNEENVTVSAQVIDWDSDEFDLNAFRIGTTLPGSSSGINNGEQMNVYVADGAARNLLSTFTYSQGSDSWTASPAVYWENISGTPAFYGSILRAAKLNDTQLDDYLVADPVTPVEGAPVNFTLRHPAAKVIVQLKSTDATFSTAELSNMVITLPNYIMGATVNNGVFEPDTSDPTGDIQVAVVNNNATAIIRPQTAIAGRTVINIHDPATGRDYPVTHSVNIQFSAGIATTLIIDMGKTAVGLSANVIDWEDGAQIPLVPQAITVSGTLDQSSTFFRNKTIYAYKLGSDFKELTYSYLPASGGSSTYTWQGTETLYWDDLNGQPLNITGVYYPEQAPIPALSQNTTSFAWNLPVNQSTGYNQYDIMMSHLSFQTPSYVNFNFTHILSRVRVRIVSDEFTATELQGASVVLNNMIVDGSASINTGTATAANTPKNITPYTETTQNGIEYSALVMPQTITTGTTLVTVTLRDYPTTPFPGTLDRNLVFVPGKENLITITLRKTEILISATLEEWTTGDSGSIIIQ